MSSALVFTGVEYADLTSPVVLVGDFDITFDIKSGSSLPATMAIVSTNSGSNGWFGRWQGNFLFYWGGVISPVRPEFNPDTDYVVRLWRSGSSCQFTINDITYPAFTNSNDLIITRFSTTGGSSRFVGMLRQFTIDGHHNWSPDASDRSNTGNQPELIDSLGNNHANGFNFSVDGSAWFTEGGASETHFLSGSITQTIGTTASYLKGAELSATVGQAFTLDGSYTKLAQLESSFVQSYSIISAVSKSIQLNDSLNQSTQTSSSYLKAISLAGLCTNPNQTDSSLIKTTSLAASIVQSLSLNSDYSKFGFVSGSVLQPSATYGSYFNESNEIHSLASALTQTVVTLSSYNKTAKLSTVVNQLHNQLGDYSKGVNLTAVLSQEISGSSLYNKASIHADELVVVTQTVSLLTKLANVYGQLTQTFTTTGYLFNPDDIQVVQTFLRFDGQLIETRFDGVINEHRQDGSLNTNTQVTLMLYESSYQQFKTAILGHSAADFTNAKYQIFARLGGTPLVEKSLGAGIERTGSEFVTTIEATDITRPGTYYHQFIVYNQDNQPLPPVFAGEIKFHEVK